MDRPDLCGALDARIARLQAELDELVELRRLMQKHIVAPGPGPVPVQGDLIGARIAEAAEAVLGRSGDLWVHYRDVARQAVERGYRGRDPDQPFKVTAASFYHIMRRRTAIFERRAAVFRLAGSRPSRDDA